MKEHSHVAKILEEAKKAAKEGDVVALKSLSDKTIHATTVHQDTDNVLVAIVVYALAKLIERKHIFSNKDYHKYLDYYIGTINVFIDCAKKDKCEVFRNRVNEIMKVPGLSKELKSHVTDVFNKARINKASKIYEHGISMEATAKLLGISLWELAEYTGQSNISDSRENQTIDVKKRIKKAMEIFE